MGDAGPGVAGGSREGCGTGSPLPWGRRVARMAAVAMVAAVAAVVAVAMVTVAAGTGGTASQR